MSDNDAPDEDDLPDARYSPEDHKEAQEELLQRLRDDGVID